MQITENNNFINQWSSYFLFRIQEQICSNFLLINHS